MHLIAGRLQVRLEDIRHFRMILSHHDARLHRLHPIWCGCGGRAGQGRKVWHGGRRIHGAVGVGGLLWTTCQFRIRTNRAVPESRCLPAPENAHKKQCPARPRAERNMLIDEFAINGLRRDGSHLTADFPAAVRARVDIGVRRTGVDTRDQRIPRERCNKRRTRLRDAADRNLPGY